MAETFNAHDPFLPIAGAGEIDCRDPDSFAYIQVVYVDKLQQVLEGVQAAEFAISSGVQQKNKYSKIFSPLMWSAWNTGYWYMMKYYSCSNEPVHGSPVSSDPNPQRAISGAPEILDAPTDELQETEIGDRFPAAWIAIEYRHDAEEAWREISQLPEDVQQEFLSALDEDPRCDVRQLSAEILAKLEKQRRPFDTEEMNDAYEAAAKISKEAAVEFQTAVETLGSTVEPEIILQRVEANFFPDSIIEEGWIGHRPYLILRDGSFLVQNMAGHWVSFNSEEIARKSMPSIGTGPKIPRSE